MKKILIIRFSSIGDIVLTTPVVRCLKVQLGAEIHYLTKRPYFPLLEANPHLSQIFTIEKKVSEVLPQLKKESYDCIVDLHVNLRSWQVRLALRKQTFAFKKLNFEKWLLVNFKVNRLPDVHIVDRYLASVAPLGVKNDGKGLDYFFPDDFSPQFPIPGPQSAYIAFAIGAAHSTKRLPTEKVIEICRQLIPISRQGAEQPIVLLGGRNEFAEGEKIVAQSGPHVVNACGKMSLHESAAIIQRAAKVVTNDTGMMHVAAALGKDILSIWGSTVPAFGMAPYFGEKNATDTRFEVQNLTCRPCSKIGFGECPKGHFKCMAEQDTDRILEHIGTS